MRIDIAQRRFAIVLVVASFLSLIVTVIAAAQQLDAASVISLVDTAVKDRIENIGGYTATEHYAVYRGADENHPVAEMTVNTTYQRDSGKVYTIVSRTGSEIVQRLLLDAILDSEKHINLPGIREGAWITSANYVFKLKPGGTQRLGGRGCFLISMVPRRKAPYLIEGTLWVDSKDGSIVQVQGAASKSSSFLTGPTQVMRQYENISGYPQATHVRAVSDSHLFGQTIVKIDYQDYHIQPRPSL